MGVQILFLIIAAAANRTHDLWKLGFLLTLCASQLDYLDNQRIRYSQS